MRDYIILNGKKSTEITGLLVERLPVISKPMMRTEILEIDGRDGDIVNKLGYSAYDKEIVVGLHGDFNIDEVIAYFNSEGTVVFSNEVTKYYRYQIVKQIDFAKLLRFREATVTFHVQPFKYSTIEDTHELIDEEQLLQMVDSEVTQNGITGEGSTAFSVEIPGFPATTGIFLVRGTAVGAAEIYLPITAELPPGAHSLNLYTIPIDPGDEEECLVKLVKDGTVNSFGDTFAALEDGAVTGITAVDTVRKTYNYLYIYVPDGATVKFAIGAWLRGGNDECVLTNHGNVVSRPKLTVEGSGNITLALNGMDVFKLTMGEDDTIVIDTEQLEAYTGDTLRNRSVKGNYDNFALLPGDNTITWTGTVKQITAEHYSRWL